MTDIGERGETLLKALIELYINEGQPVGSRTLARHADLSLSAATVRNVMSDLEELGLIHAPHTSAGRIPTQLGYRLFVDSLLTVKPLNDQAVDSIQARLSTESDPPNAVGHGHRNVVQGDPFCRTNSSTGAGKCQVSPDRVFEVIGEPCAHHPDNRRWQGTESGDTPPIGSIPHPSSSKPPTASTTYTVAPPWPKFDGYCWGNENRQRRDAQHHENSVAVAGKMFDEEEVEKDDVVLSGEENLLNIPDLCQIDTLQRLFDAFKTKQDLLDLLDRSMRVNGISIFIGEESGYQALNDVSVVTSPYQSEGSVVGTLGVIGPTRMTMKK